MKTILRRKDPRLMVIYQNEFMAVGRGYAKPVNYFQAVDLMAVAPYIKVFAIFNKGDRPEKTHSRHIVDIEVADSETGKQLINFLNIHSKS